MSSGWLDIWGVFLGASVGLFLLLVVLVTVRGLGDIRTLLRKQRVRRGEE